MYIAEGISSHILYRFWWLEKRVWISLRIATPKIIIFFLALLSAWWYLKGISKTQSKQKFSCKDIFFFIGMPYLYFLLAILTTWIERLFPSTNFWAFLITFGLCIIGYFIIPLLYITFTLWWNRIRLTNQFR